MTKKPISNKDKIRKLDQYSKRALQNGEDFYNDAKTIFNKNNSYGHSFALLVLAEEEFAKAWLSHLFYVLIKNNILWFSEDEDALNLSKIFTEHKFKQIAMEYLWKISNMFMNISEAPSFDNLSNEEAVQTLMDFLDKIDNQNDKEKKKNMILIEKEFRSMDKEKQIGLYVDFGNNNKIIAPSDITKSKCIKQFDKTYISWKIITNWLNIFISENLDEREILILKRFRKKLSDSNE